MTEITNTLTSYKCDWEPCGLRSYISNDGLPGGWVGAYFVQFCSEQHLKLFFDSIYAEDDIEPIMCKYCGVRLNCTDPDYHRGRPGELRFGVYGTFRMEHHLEWWFLIHDYGSGYFCSMDHVDLWKKEHA